MAGQLGMVPKNQLLPLVAAGVDRVCVIGLDCASPDLVFERFNDHLPNLTALGRQGAYGTLHSSHPPITVPAWRVMASGRDAGCNGVYGFRTRIGRGYDSFQLTQAEHFQAAPVWERLAEEGMRTTLLGLPGTFPPAPLAGKMVSGPMTPHEEGAFTWPPQLATRIRQIAPDYAFDVEEFRRVPLPTLVKSVRGMTKDRFRVARQLARDDDWNLFWLVEIGLDRLQHALWHTVAKNRPPNATTGDGALDDALRDYYVMLDAELGRMVEICDDGRTAFMVVSDHGARTMLGGVCINRWLEQHGYLALKPNVAAQPFDTRLVEWERTRAWGIGGYCGRIFFNIAGREPEGTLAPDDADGLIAELTQCLKTLTLPDGTTIRNQVVCPTDIYAETRGLPPDLIVYFGDLDFRALNLVGPGAIYVDENDTGSDGANHDWLGLYIVSGPGITTTGRAAQAHISDVATAIERLLS